jgi:hypothetical protein
VGGEIEVEFRGHVCDSKQEQLGTIAVESVE